MLKNYACTYLNPNLCDGTSVDISEEKFLKYFWWCWNKLKVHVQLCCFSYDDATLCWMHRPTMKHNCLVSSCCFQFITKAAGWWGKWVYLQEKTDDDIPMPPYFRFIALLAFKIFSAEQVNRQQTLRPLSVLLCSCFQPLHISIHVGLNNSIFSSLILLA
jgi:hypothetical protein